jgi:hypothetical protein
MVVGGVVLEEGLDSIPRMVLICKSVKRGCGIDSPRGRLFLHLLHSSRKLASLHCIGVHHLCAKYDDACTMIASLYSALLFSR